MTRKEITQKLARLSAEAYSLGCACTDAYYKDTNVAASVLLYTLGEFLKNTTFTMDSFQGQLETIE